MVKFLHSMALGGGELYAKFVYFNTDDSPTTSDPWAAPLRFLSPVNFASRLVGVNEDFIRSSRMVSRLPSNEDSPRGLQVPSGYLSETLLEANTAVSAFGVFLLSLCSQSGVSRPTATRIIAQHAASLKTNRPHLRAVSGEKM